MAKNLDSQIDKIRQGTIARAALTEVEARIVKKELQLLNKAIGLYNGNQLNGEAAQMTIAAIAELRSVLSSLDREAQEGTRARQEEIGGPLPN